MKFRRIATRLSMLLTGHAVNWLLSWPFDYLLYPAVIWILGIWVGGLAMTFFSFAYCLATIWAYDKMKKDWLGLEAIKGLKVGIGRGWLKQATAWLATRSEWLAMLVLSIQTDPFITTVYMRHGQNQYSGLSPRDWKIFLSSVIIANVYWTLMMALGVEVLEYSYLNWIKEFLGL